MTEPHPQPRHRPKLGGMATSLLTDLLTNTLDKGYAEAAARRKTGEPAPSRVRARWLVALGLVLAGVLFGAGYQQTRANAPDSQRAKAALIRDIEAKTTTRQQLERQVEDLTATVASERDAALRASTEGSATAEQLGVLERRTGLAAVRGPGVEVTLGDAPSQTSTDPVTGKKTTVPPPDAGRISDRDLQLVVNTLWAIGAEAIAVDGRRLAPTSTIREAGGAIQVDFFPVTTPYTVQAIGDDDLLLAKFVDSRVGQSFQTLIGVYGIAFDIAKPDSPIILRAAPGSDLKYASAVPTTSPSAPSTPTAPSGSSASSAGTPSPGGTS